MVHEAEAAAAALGDTTTGGGGGGGGGGGQPSPEKVGPEGVGGEKEQAKEKAKNRRLSLERQDTRGRLRAELATVKKDHARQIHFARQLTRDLEESEAAQADALDDMASELSAAKEEAEEAERERTKLNRALTDVQVRKTPLCRDMSLH